MDLMTPPYEEFSAFQFPPMAASIREFRLLRHDGEFFSGDWEGDAVSFLRSSFPVILASPPYSGSTLRGLELCSAI